MLQTLLAFQGSQGSHSTNKYQGTVTYQVTADTCPTLFVILSHPEISLGLCLLADILRAPWTDSCCSFMQTFSAHYSLSSYSEVNWSFSYFQLCNWNYTSYASVDWYSTRFSLHTSPIIQLVLSLSRLSASHSGHSINALRHSSIYYI